MALYCNIDEMYRDFCSKIRRINAEYRSSSHLCVGVRECVVRESACMACKRSPVRSRYSPPDLRHCTGMCGVFFCFAATRIACCFVFTSTCKNAFPGAAARLPCPIAKTPGRPIPNQPPGVVLCQKSPACTFTAGCRTGRSSPASTGWKAGSSPHTVRWSGPHRGRTAGPWRWWWCRRA